MNGLIPFERTIEKTTALENYKLTRAATLLSLNKLKPDLNLFPENIL